LIHFYKSQSEFIAMWFMIAVTFNLLVGQVISRSSMVDLEGETVRMLDATVQLMQGDAGEFDREYLTDLSSCMESLSPELWKVSNGAWAGMVAYHQSNGTGNDTWGSCLGNGHCHEYHEQNLTIQDYQGIGIYEPCNYVSNLAYYHVVTSICENTQWNVDPSYQKAMAQAFTSLTVGSAFWHGSHTLLGNIADNRFIEVVAFLAHQASLENLPVSDSLRDLSVTPRRNSAKETAQQLANLLKDSPVDNWKDGIAELDTPDYMVTFSAIICTLLTLQQPTEQVDAIIPLLMDAFNLPEDARTFILEEYLPEIRNSTADIQLGLIEKPRLQLNTLGTLMKLMYAFLWQEYVLTDADIFLDPEVNQLGFTFMVTVNQIANFLTSFPILDASLQAGIGIYPGEEWCMPQEPHAKWHVESANGLMDLMLLADHVFMLTA